jgi:hypothetical protein
MGETTDRENGELSNTGEVCKNLKFTEEQLVRLVVLLTRGKQVTEKKENCLTRLRSVQASSSLRSNWCGWRNYCQGRVNKVFDK